MHNKFEFAVDKSFGVRFMGAHIFDQGLNFSLVQLWGSDRSRKGSCPAPSVSKVAGFMPNSRTRVALNKFNRKFIIKVYKQLANSFNPFTTKPPHVYRVQCTRGNNVQVFNKMTTHAPQTGMHTTMKEGHTTAGSTGPGGYGRMILTVKSGSFERSMLLSLTALFRLLFVSLIIIHCRGFWCFPG
jgi:hypothetical protein